MKKQRGCLKRLFNSAPGIALPTQSSGLCIYSGGSSYKKEGKEKAREEYLKAEEALKKSLEIDPSYEMAYTELGICYGDQSKFKEAYELSAKIVKEKIQDDRLLGLVATTYISQGKYKEARDYYRKAEDSRLTYYNPSTRHNYRKIKEMAAERGAKLVCMQYPMRNIEPLRRLFDSTEGLIFVNNERVFKDALKKYKYEELFLDNFGGDFGHGTPLGNKLIAENAASVIIKEVFKK